MSDTKKMGFVVFRTFHKAQCLINDAQHGINIRIFEIKVKLQNLNLFFWIIFRILRY